MRSFYVRAAALCLVAALALSACDSGSPDDDDDDDPDPPVGNVTGTWLHEFTGEGITGRYTLTDTPGVIGGSVDLYYTYPGPIVATFPVTGTHTGSDVEFDHDVLDGDADPGVTYHFELTITSNTQMSGTRALSTGAVLDGDAYFVRQIVLP